MTLIQRRCSECGEPWPLEEFRVGTSAYSEHCEICRTLVADRIMRWQEQMYILSCFLYEQGFECVLGDASFDDLCTKLKSWWSDLSPEFQERCGANLDAGTGLGIEFSDEEKAAALAWFHRVHGRVPEALDDI